MKHFVFLLIVTLAACSPLGEATPTPTTLSTPETSELTDNGQVEKVTLVADREGQTVYELMTEQVEFETEDYGEAGLFVTSINGVSSTNQNYWAFYVNGEYAQAGISQTVLNSGDIVEFVYEEIDATPL